jgi:hypothetical protein
MHWYFPITGRVSSPRVIGSSTTEWMGCGRWGRYACTMLWLVPVTRQNKARPEERGRVVLDWTTRNSTDSKKGRKVNQLPMESGNSRLSVPN